MPSGTVIPKHVQYVVDGGALLHQVPWLNGPAFANIMIRYTEYVIKKYGKAIIVFDGYSGASTKDMTHRRRAKGKKGPTVAFSLGICLTVTKENFLRDAFNKQRFIKFLAESLQVAGCEVFHAISDADTLIVQKAVEVADYQDTVLVRNDTDLLILSLFHARTTSDNLFFAPEPKKNSTPGHQANKNRCGAFYLQAHSLSPCFARV